MIPPDIEVGDLVHITTDLSKGKQRDRYIVAKVDGEFCSLRKFTGSQLREAAVRVKKSMCYHVPNYQPPSPTSREASYDDGDEELNRLPDSTSSPQDVATPDITECRNEAIQRHENSLPPTSPESETSNSRPAIEECTSAVVDEDISPFVEPVTPTEVVSPRRSGRTRYPPDYYGVYKE